MKEAIYTIPVNEAFEADCACPFCYLSSKLEAETISYTLGASMMEPDARSITNQQGFCAKHFAQLLALPNKLSLALVLESHLEDVRKRIDICQANITASSESKKNSLFSRSKQTSSVTNATMLSNILKGIGATCAVCAKIDATMQRYLDVFFYLWVNDSGFRKNFDSKEGFCLQHYQLLVSESCEFLKDKQQSEFLKNIYEKQQKSLAALQQDIHHFTLKFDYRNSDMPWGNAQDAPQRLIEKLTGPLEK